MRLTDQENFSIPTRQDHAFNIAGRIAVGAVPCLLIWREPRFLLAFPVLWFLASRWFGERLEYLAGLLLGLWIVAAIGFGLPFWLLGTTAWWIRWPVSLLCFIYGLYMVIMENLPGEKTI